MNSNVRDALQYLINTGESVNAAQFDDDHEPVGPMLRQDIAAYVRIDKAGILKLTDEARAALGKGEQR